MCFESDPSSAKNSSIHSKAKLASRIALGNARQSRRSTSEQKLAHIGCDVKKELKSRSHICQAGVVLTGERGGEGPREEAIKAEENFTDQMPCPFSIVVVSNSRFLTHTIA